MKEIISPRATLVAMTEIIASSVTGLASFEPHPAAAIKEASTISLISSFIIAPFKCDDFVKSPSAALRCILSHCGVQVSTPHAFVFARFSVHLKLFTLSSVF
jgi:hypothetical protein